jgi:hypothetical protein
MKKFIFVLLVVSAGAATFARPGGVGSVGPLRPQAPTAPSSYKYNTAAEDPIPVPHPEPTRHCPPGPNCCNMMCRAS